MATKLEPPDGWSRASATHLDRKYSSATPVVYEHEESDRQVQIVPALVEAPGSETEWRVRDVTNGTTLVRESAESRSAAVAIAMEAMRGH